MLISHELLKEINKIQTEMLKHICDVCEQLQIKFFMVHGSLLGTVRQNSFIDDDDDIDIAFFREDYNRFLQEAPRLLPSNYFVQSNVSDPHYPLEFSKVRNSDTTYIIEIAKDLPINHGVYIDVFPIDYCKHGTLGAKIFNLKYKLRKLRVSYVWKAKKISLKRKAVRVFVKTLCPSLKRSVKKIDKMLTSVKASDYVRVSGGKGKEQGIPRRWFASAQEAFFEGLKVYIPVGYKEYLTKIYGDYENRTLVENKISDEQSIEVNACLIDLQKPYKNYI